MLGDFITSGLSVSSVNDASVRSPMSGTSQASVPGSGAECPCAEAAAVPAAHGTRRGRSVEEPFFPRAVPQVYSSLTQQATLATSADKPTMSSFRRSDAHDSRFTGARVAPRRGRARGRARRSGRSPAAARSLLGSSSLQTKQRVRRSLSRPRDQLPSRARFARAKLW